MFNMEVKKLVTGDVKSFILTLHMDVAFCLFLLLNTLIWNILTLYSGHSTTPLRVGNAGDNSGLESRSNGGNKPAEVFI